MAIYKVKENTEGFFGSIPEALASACADKHECGEKLVIEVYGTIHITETLKINPAMLPCNPVKVIGMEGAAISGGMALTGFEKYKDNVWRVAVPSVEYTRHIFVDGKPAPRTSTEHRMPFRWEALKGDDYDFYDVPEIKYEDEFQHLGIATTHTEMLGWKNITDVEMVFEKGWTHHIIPIEYIKPLEDGRVFIKPVEPCFEASCTSGGAHLTEGCPNYLENIFELLGKPGEWYYDRTERMLYIGFAEGDSPENHSIIIPLVEQLMELKGTVDNKLTGLTFENMTFKDNTWLRAGRFGHPETQANQLAFKTIPEALKAEKPYEFDYRKVIASVRLLACRGVKFIGCDFTDMGTDALSFEFGSEDCKVIASRFYEIGGSAVVVGEFGYSVDGENRAHHPSDRREITRAIRVANNYIHDTGKDFKGSVAIMCGYIQDCELLHNTIHDVPYSAISMGWGWGTSDTTVGPYRVTKFTEPSCCKRNKIMYNHVYRCMMQLCDGGAIYTLGCMDGTMICGNYIHESSGYQGEGFAGLDVGGYNTESVHDKAADPFFARHGVPGGIYCDEGSRGIEVSGNVFHDVAVPLFYHNQIDEGYKRMTYLDNTFNLRPGDEGFPTVIAENAGIETEFADIME